MSESTLIAHRDNMEFYISLTSKTSNQVEIVMYSTIYVLTQKDGKCMNATSNKLNLSDPLIAAVIKAVNN